MHTINEDIETYMIEAEGIGFSRSGGEGEGDGDGGSRGTKRKLDSSS